MTFELKFLFTQSINKDFNNVINGQLKGILKNSSIKIELINARNWVKKYYNNNLIKVVLK
jgi:hypothetical protein